MAAKDEGVIHLVNPYSLEMACQTLREAILRLPRGMMRERLFVSLLKALGHLHARHFVLMQRIFSSMRILVKDPIVTDEVRNSLREVSNQVAALLCASCSI